LPFGKPCDIKEIERIGIYRFLSAEGAKASPWGEAGKNL
jgi:hypothetical protein